MMALALALATIAPPEPRNNPQVISYYPPAALQLLQGRWEQIELVISPESRIQSCKVKYSTGYDDLDAIACSFANKYAISPATDANGMPVYGVMHLDFVWDQVTRIHSPADIQVPVPWLDGPQSKRVNLAIVVSDRGAVEDCGVFHSSGDRLTDEKGCLLARQWTGLRVITDNNQTPVRFVQTRSIQFLGEAEQGGQTEGGKAH